MFNNIGKKIMNLAKFLCWAGIILSISIGVSLICLGIGLENQEIISDFLGKTLKIYGILLTILGPIFSWLNSFVLYGFGKLIQNSDIIANRY